MQKFYFRYKKYVEVEDALRGFSSVAALYPPKLRVQCFKVLVVFHAAHPHPPIRSPHQL